MPLSKEDIKDYKNGIDLRLLIIDNTLKEIKTMQQKLSKQEPEELKPEELKPTDWSGLGCWINDNGVIDSGRLDNIELFSSIMADDLKPLAKRQQIQSVIWNLKHALGDKHEFEQNERAFFTCFGYNEKEWVSCYDLNLNSGVIYFESEENAKQVADFLNKNYPEGWK